jgi:hypothetical protein
MELRCYMSKPILPVIPSIHLRGYFVIDLTRPESDGPSLSKIFYCPKGGKDGVK